MQRTFAVGIVAIAAVNDLLDAPDSHPRLAVQLAAVHCRLRNYAKAAIREESTDPTTSYRLAGQEFTVGVEQDGRRLWFIHVYPQPLAIGLEPVLQVERSRARARPRSGQ